MDINDNAPAFLDSELKWDIMENTNNQKYVVQKSANDPDLNYSIAGYLLVPCNDSNTLFECGSKPITVDTFKQIKAAMAKNELVFGIFELDTSQKTIDNVIEPQIKAMRPLDREHQAEYYMKLIAYDYGSISTNDTNFSQKYGTIIVRVQGMITKVFLNFECNACIKF